MRSSSLNAGWLSLGLSWGGCLLGLIFVGGCNKAPPPITKRTYTVPAAIIKQEQEEAQLEKNRLAFRQGMRPEETRSNLEPQQMLAALVPQPETEVFWSFKVQGPPVELARLKPALVKFLGTLEWKSKEGTLPEWQLPDGWQVMAQEDGFGRVATITLPGELTPHKIAVAKFTYQGDWKAAALANLNRWRGQLQLEPLELAGLEAAAEKISFTGGDAILMDETGIAVARPGMTPPAAATPPKSEASNEPKQESKPTPETPPSADERPKLLDYEIPAAWQPIQGSALRVASFVVTGDEQSAEIAVTQFPKVASMADPLANVNRWRGELGLKPATAAELPEQTTELKISDDPATIFFATGTLRDKPASTLAAMIVRADKVWFVKMQGDAALVAQQRATFEEFVKSLKFKE